MKPQRFIRSSKNRKVGQTVVIDDMSHKLASGSNVAAVRRMKRAASRVTTAAVYAGCVLALAASFAIVMWKQYRDDRIAAQAGLVYSNPVDLLRMAKTAGEIGAPEYARHLSSILVNFNALPGRFRPNIPLFTADEVHAQLKSVWDQLDSATQASLSRHAPMISAKRPTL